MKFNDVKQKTVRKVYDGCFLVKKFSPEILFVAGVVGTVASTVMACKSTLKAAEIVKEHKENLDAIDKVMNDDEYAEVREEQNYDETQYKADLRNAYIQTGVKLVKTYAPAAALGVISIGCLTGSNRILKNRNVAVTAAYEALYTGYSNYRKRVVERIGEEAEKEIRYGLVKKDIKETVTDENGKEKKVTKKTQVIENPYAHSPFSKFFDSTSKYWEKDPEYNLMFVTNVERHANDKLRTKGRLFLNEVYRDLGLEETKIGQVYGWVYDENNPDGDNYVDFGIFETTVANTRFVNGLEPVILLDFNVDGNIWEKM